MKQTLLRSMVAVALVLPMAAYCQTSSGAAGPVPSAILSAHTLFISNGGSDAGLFPSPFTGDVNRPYDEFYTALQADSHYQLVSDPSQADLVLELQLIAPLGPTQPNKAQGAADAEPQFRLVIYDRRTHYVLWTLTQPIHWAVKKATHNQNFDDALTQLVKDFEGLGQGQKSAA